jgi:hypothetical protein
MATYTNIERINIFIAPGFFGYTLTVMIEKGFFDTATTETHRSGRLNVTRTCPFCHGLDNNQ